MLRLCPIDQIYFIADESAKMAFLIWIDRDVTRRYEQSDRRSKVT